MPTARTMVLSSAAAAALLLTSCAEQSPLKHDEVIDKRGHEDRWVSVYENIYREKNCTTNALSLSLPGRTTGSSGSQSSTSGGRTGTSSNSSGGSTPGGKSGKSGGTNSDSSSTAAASTSGGSRQNENCGREVVGRKKTGRQWKPGEWELKLRDGDRTDWLQVTHEKYEATDLHDQI